MIDPIIIKILTIRELLDIICTYLSLDEIFNLYTIANIPMSLKWVDKIHYHKNKYRYHPKGMIMLEHSI